MRRPCGAAAFSILMVRLQWLVQPAAYSTATRTMNFEEARLSDDQSEGRAELDRATLAQLFDAEGLRWIKELPRPFHIDGMNSKRSTRTRNG